MTLAIERNLYLGADPGKNGGLALLDRAGLVVDVSPMPETEHELTEYIKEFAPRIRMAHIEKVHSAPGQGVASTFTFGGWFGTLKTALAAHYVPFELISPNHWQKAMYCQMPGRKNLEDKKTEKKNFTKARALALFPGQVKAITHRTADALLLAEHCRRAFCCQKCGARI